jgi:hypothetical protein
MERIEQMLKYQSQWAEEYRMQQAMKKLEKGRAEKARVKAKLEAKKI